MKSTSLTKIIILLTLIALLFTCTIGCNKDTNSDNILEGLTTYANYDASFVKKIGEYRNLTIEKDISCDDNDLLEYYYTLCSGILQRCDFEDEEPVLDDLFLELMSFCTKDTCEINDYICFDYSGHMEDGTAVSSNTYQTVMLGQELFIPGFETKIIGHKVNEDFAINVTFPSYYPNDTSLQDKEVIFDIKIHYIMPELSDDVVKVLDKYNKENYAGSDYTSLYTNKEEFLDYARKDIVSTKEENFTNQFENLITYNLFEQSEFGEFPETQISSFKSSVQSQAESYGVSLEVFLYYCYGITNEDDFTALAEYQVAMRGMFAIIVQNEQMKVSQAEYDNFLKESYEDYGYDSASELESGIGKDNLCNSILSSKVLQYIKDHLTIKVVE